jgi:hypothetical protein
MRRVPPGARSICVARRDLVGEGRKVGGRVSRCGGSGTATGRRGDRYEASRRQLGGLGNRGKACRTLCADPRTVPERPSRRIRSPICRSERELSPETIQPREPGAPGSPDSRPAIGSGRFRPSCMTGDAAGDKIANPPRDSPCTNRQVNTGHSCSRRRFALGQPIYTRVS